MLCDIYSWQHFCQHTPSEKSLLYHVRIHVFSSLPYMIINNTANENFTSFQGLQNEQGSQCSSKFNRSCCLWWMVSFGRCCCFSYHCCPFLYSKPLQRSLLWKEIVCYTGNKFWLHRVQGKVCCLGAILLTESTLQMTRVTSLLSLSISLDPYPKEKKSDRCDILCANTNGSFSCTSRAAALTRPSFKAAAKACSSTSPPLAVFTKNAPKTKHKNNWIEFLFQWSSVNNTIAKLWPLLQENLPLKMWELQGLESFCLCHSQHSLLKYYSDPTDASYG